MTVPWRGEVGQEWWFERAACRCADVESGTFYPPARFEPKQERSARERRAKTVCRRCDVAAECLAFAIREGELHGIWGGTTESERLPMMPR